MPTSRVFTKRPAPPPQEALDELRAAEVAWLSDALSFGLMDSGIKPLWGITTRVVGTALTVRTPPGDFALIPWALDLAREGDVLVIDTAGETKRAVWGDYFSGWAQAQGIAAVVIDGASRDRGAIEELQYPVFARATIPRAPTLNGPGEVNVPVVCGGVCVMPGDIVVADSEGVAVVAQRDLEAALTAVRAKVESETSLPKPSREAWPGFFGFFGQRAEPVIVESTWDEPGAHA